MLVPIGFLAMVVGAQPASATLPTCDGSESRAAEAAYILAQGRAEAAQTALLRANGRVLAAKAALAADPCGPDPGGPACTVATEEYIAAVDAYMRADDAATAAEVELRAAAAMRCTAR